MGKILFLNYVNCATCKYFFYYKTKVKILFENAHNMAHIHTQPKKLLKKLKAQDGIHVGKAPLSFDCSQLLDTLDTLGS